MLVQSGCGLFATAGWEQTLKSEQLASATVVELICASEFPRILSDCKRSIVFAFGAAGFDATGGWEAGDLVFTGTLGNCVVGEQPTVVSRTTKTARRHRDRLVPATERGLETANRCFMPRAFHKSSRQLTPAEQTEKGGRKTASSRL